MLKIILLDLFITMIISSQLSKTQIYDTFGGIILSHEKYTSVGNASFNIHSFLK